MSFGETPASAPTGGRSRSLPGRSARFARSSSSSGFQAFRPPYRPHSLVALFITASASREAPTRRCRGPHDADQMTGSARQARRVAFSSSKGLPTMSLDYEIYDLGDVKLQRGATLRDCKLAYKTFGTLNAAKDNVIVYPTWYSGQHYDNEWLIGEGRALDPAKYFIIIPNMLGNGLSSSPSNTPEPYNGPRFPHVTPYDNVRAQHRFVVEKFGIKHIRLVVGWSMGALQTFHWAALYPDMMDLIAPFCGSAKCSRHNFVFLEGVKAALTADAAWKEGWYTEKPARGLRAAARVYAGWGFSQAFYRQKLDIEALGYSSLEDFLVAFWEGFFLPKDPNNLLTMLWT